jgi:DNA mismatch repair protein MutS
MIFHPRGFTRNASDPGRCRRFAARVMNVDWQTLQDLGILQPEGWQASLFDWANQTRTAGGAGLLRERFRRPLSDPAALRRTQEAVRWLADRPERFERLLEPSAWRSIERYTDTSVVALDYPLRLFLWLDSWWVRLLNRDLYREVAAALALTQALVRHAHRLAGELRAEALPPLLADWVRQLEECLEAPPLQRLRDGKEVHRRFPPGVLGLDGELRRADFEPLLALTAIVYEIDLLRSLALATRKHGLSWPDILDEQPPRLEAVALRHPLLDDPVANDVRMDADGRLIFLTGPNMAGKSTFLKSVGLAVFLAQLGMGVPARSCRLTPFGCLFSGINTTDNLRLGQSFFYREVRRVRDATEILGRGTAALMLFDEMFKGTNLKDASDASLAVLAGFAACRSSAFVVASHIAELAHGLEALPGVRFLRFEADVDGGDAVFDYRLREGVSAQRLGRMILEREGVLARLARLGTPEGARPLENDAGSAAAAARLP